MMDDGSPIITMRRDHYFTFFSRAGLRGASMFGGHRRSVMRMSGSIMGDLLHQSTYDGSWWSVSRSSSITTCNEEDERFYETISALIAAAEIET